MFNHVFDLYSVIERISEYNIAKERHLYIYRN